MHRKFEDLDAIKISFVTKIKERLSDGTEVENRYLNVRTIFSKAETPEDFRSLTLDEMTELKQKILGTGLMTEDEWSAMYLSIDEFKTHTQRMVDGSDAKDKVDITIRKLGMTSE